MAKTLRDSILEELNKILELCPIPSKRENIILERHSKDELFGIITILITEITELRKKLGSVFWCDQFI